MVEAKDTKKAHRDHEGDKPSSLKLTLSFGLHAILLPPFHICQAMLAQCTCRWLFIIYATLTPIALPGLSWCTPLCFRLQGKGEGQQLEARNQILRQQGLRWLAGKYWNVYQVSGLNSQALQESTGTCIR